jgi:hypothetical protein
MTDSINISQFFALPGRSPMSVGGVPLLPSGGALGQECAFRDLKAGLSWELRRVEDPSGRGTF